MNTRNPRRVFDLANAPIVIVAVALTCAAPAREVGAQVFRGPEALGTNAAVDRGRDYQPQLATDGAGTWIAVWTSRDSLAGSIGGDEDILFVRSTDLGATWTEPTPLNTNASSDRGNDRGPRLTTDGAGTWMAVWFSADDLGGTIGFDEDILVSRSTDGGENWTDPQPLNANAARDFGDDAFPQIVTDGAGTWTAVWFSDDDLGGSIGLDRDILISRSTNDGASWTAPRPLDRNADVDSEDDSFARAAVGATSWVVIWHSEGGLKGAGRGIVLSRSTDEGETWTEPEALTAIPADGWVRDNAPQVSTDGAGGWLVVWYSYDDLDGTIGMDGDILVSRSTDGGVSWSGPEALNANASTDSGDDYHPQVTSGGDGRWMAIWYSYDDLDGTIGFDRDILVARSRDGGATWTTPEALSAHGKNDHGDDLYPQLTTDGAGSWIAVWASTDSLGGLIGQDSDVLLSRAPARRATAVRAERRRRLSRRPR